MVLATYALRNGTNLETDFYDFQGGNIIEKHIGGTVSWRNNNPGNITIRGGVLAGSFAAAEGAIGVYTNGSFSYAIFPTEQIGATAVIDLLEGSAYRGAGLTINQAIANYSGATGTELTNYQNLVANKAGVSGTTLLSSLTASQFSSIEQGIKQFEGFTVGTDVVLTPNPGGSPGVSFTVASL